MTAFQTISLLLTTAAAGACINHKFLKLPPSIGMMAFALFISFVGIGLNHFSLIDLREASDFVARLDFSNILLHGLLSFLLFAAAMHINLADLKKYRSIVAVLATVGVVIATVVTGSLVWYASSLLNYNLSFIDALLFGALIAPTDPVAVMGILKDTKVSKDLLVKIGSESLLNDGVGVVIFLVILNIATHPDMQISLSEIGFLLEWAGGGGMALGLALGWLGWQTLRHIDDYKIEVLVTLAIATGGYCLAEYVHVSAPITMVAAGLVVGHHGRLFGMSSHTRKHVDMFWELIDEILNAVLFMLMGLMMIVISMKTMHMPIGIIAIVATLIGRLVSVGIPILLMDTRFGFSRGTITLLTWGGLRGGIAMALALSIPAIENKDTILTMTYVTVIFSVLVQGTTFRTVAQRVIRQEKAK